MAKAQRWGVGAALALLAASSWVAFVPQAAQAAATQANRRAAPLPGRLVPTPTGPVREYTLRNGLTVLLQENHAAPVVSFVVSYKVGSRHEPVGTTGSAHLLEHMLFKGTERFAKGQIARLLDRNGANYNASTWYDWTNYYETYASDRLELGLLVEASRMRGALIRDDERQAEMTVVRNEMERGEAEPWGLLFHAVGGLAYQAHGYHHPIIGWRSDVEGVSTDALRAFYRTHYQPNNAVAVLVGDFDPHEAVAAIERHLGPVARGPQPPQPITTEEAQQGERMATIRRRGSTNLTLMAFPIPDVRHADIPALMVLDTVLSGGESSRLVQRVVEKEVADSAFSDCGLMANPGLFMLGAELRPDGDHAAVERALVAEVEAIATGGVTPAELARAKHLAEANYTYKSEGVEGQAKALASYASIADWGRFYSLLDGVKAVTDADLRRVASAYLKPHVRSTARFIGTPDGPIPPAPRNAGGGAAQGRNAAPPPPPLLPFERQNPPPRAGLTPQKLVLANGATVVVLPNPSSRTVSVEGFFRAGGLADPPGKDGLAGTVAALLDAGTTKRNKLAFATAREDLAAQISFGAGQSTTSASGRSLTADFPALLALMAEALTSPSFPEEELAKMKRRSIAAIKSGEDQPGTRASRAMGQAIYPPGHPNRPLNPDEEIKAVESITREDLVAFHKRYLGPNQLNLVVVGPVEPQAVARAVEAAFANWPKAEGVAPEKAPTVQAGAPVRVAIPMPDQTNVDLRFAVASPLTRKDPDYHAAVLVNDILGGSPLTGRLGLKLRDEMGLTYGTTSGFSAGLSNGPFTATITVNPANVGKARTALLAEIVRWRDQGVTQRELDDAKRSLIGSQAVGLSTSARMASSLSNILFYGLPLDQWRRSSGEIQSVTLAQANAAIKRLVDPSRLNVVAVGPIAADALR